MFTIIYTFKILPGKTKDFIYNWEELTKLIYQNQGSYGSRLHKISDLNYLAYAKWPSKAVWNNCGKNLPEIAQEFSKNMKAACQSSTTDYELEIVSDLLANNQFEKANTKPKVTGIGGIFFKGKNTDKLKQWYSENLGLAIDEYGSMFKSRDENNPKIVNYLQWSVFKNDTDYFAPSEQNYMINYRVQNMTLLVQELKKNDVTFLDEIASYDYGKFVHILDLEGNKIELWEPVDKVFNT